MIQTYLNRRKKCLNQTNINDLPNDILEEIFFYLSGNDLCKKLVFVVIQTILYLIIMIQIMINLK